MVTGIPGFSMNSQRSAALPRRHVADLRRCPPLFQPWLPEGGKHYEAANRPADYDA